MPKAVEQVTKNLLGVRTLVFDVNGNRHKINECISDMRVGEQLYVNPDSVSDNYLSIHSLGHRERQPGDALVTRTPWGYEVEMPT